jgi:surfeit locus 1 family protein
LTVLREKRRRGLVESTAFTVIGVAILIGLGVWQLERREWKHNLIAAVSERLNHAPQDLPPHASWPQLTQEAYEYRRVTFPAEFLDGQEALVYTSGSAFRPDVKGAGYWVFAPARLASGSIVLIDRGFVPLDRKDPATRAQGAPHGTINIVGIMRWPEQSGSFTPAPDLKANVWYARDTKAIAAAKHWSLDAPFYIDQESPVPPGGLPLPAKLELHLPDNHLQYAITWFGLAFGLAGVYGIWLAGRLRRRS